MSEKLTNLTIRVPQGVKDYFRAMAEDKKQSMGQTVAEYFGLTMRVPTVKFSSYDKFMIPLIWSCWKLLRMLEELMQKQVDKTPDHKRDMYVMLTNSVRTCRTILDVIVDEIDKNSNVVDEQMDSAMHDFVEAQALAQIAIQKRPKLITAYTRIIRAQFKIGS